MTVQPAALVIDDDKDICLLLSELLKINRFKPYQAYSLIAAITMLREIHPSVIFIDQRLPDGYGFNLIQDLRQIYPKARIIAMTGEEIPNNSAILNNHGADDILEKPFCIRDFNRCLLVNN